MTLEENTKGVQATVVNKHHTPRPYVVQTPEGQKYRRNRRHLNTSQVSQSLNKKSKVNSRVGQASSPDSVKQE